LSEKRISELTSTPLPAERPLASGPNDVNSADCRVYPLVCRLAMFWLLADSAIWAARAPERALLMIVMGELVSDTGLT
jgi:hypothetical protein